MELKNILVVYHSQTGQGKEILDSVVAPFSSRGIQITYLRIKCVNEFPFPWTSSQFFDAFPESFLGIPCPIEPLPELNPGLFDLVILGYAPWYLSPSIPVQSFLQSPYGKKLLCGKMVITVTGCRNMWLQAQEKIKRHLKDCGAILTGHIALYDRSPNLVSVITIIRWLIGGKKKGNFFWPDAGVSSSDIGSASRFGEIIIENLSKEKTGDIQAELYRAGAVGFKPHLALFEKNGSRIFGFWANKIIRKGRAGDPKRRAMTRLFKYYLLFVLFVISPVGWLIYSIISPFLKRKTNNQRQYFMRNLTGNSD